MTCYEEREAKLEKEYEAFILTESGKEWRKGWQEQMGSDSCGDFGDYLYDFHTEMLM